VNEFELVLFEHRPEVAAEMARCGIDAFMVDCEIAGKVDRQNGADTEIAPREIEEVAGLAAVPGIRAQCRVNRFGPWTAGEVKRALASGAHRVFLPMITAPAELEGFLRFVDERAEPACLIETAESITHLRALAALPVPTVYVGLNDLAISRGSRSIFSAIADGTIDRIREVFHDRHFGFAGATLVDAGNPVPCRLLLQELARLGAGFTFLRRSWRRDVQGRDAAVEVGRLRALFRDLRRRSSAECAADRAALVHFLGERGLHD
jgi:2-keto-3-deoxy-L-rhamnonate aldolase RhmA